jgi:septum formation protein
LKKIILASKSIDRREIFRRAGLSFEVFVTHINEERYKEKFSNPSLLVKELAKAKAINARNEFSKRENDVIIIAADTIVVLDNEIIGKAKNEEEAFSMLKKLMGRTHTLITGIAITETNNSKTIIDSDITDVEFSELSEKEIKLYIKTNEWKGRAGAYSIRDKASLFIKKIEGSSSNVIGFPMHKLFDLLRKEFNLNLLEFKGE